MGFLLHSDCLRVMEKKLTNSDLLMEPADKHSIYTHNCVDCGVDVEADKGKKGGSHGQDEQEEGDECRDDVSVWCTHPVWSTKWGNGERRDLVFREELGGSIIDAPST